MVTRRTVASAQTTNRTTVMGDKTKAAKIIPKTRPATVACAAVGVVILLYVVHPESNFFSWSSGPSPDITAVTWNMAAINNNPFEYWITSDDDVYNKLMEDVSGFINDPGERDVPVSSIFTPTMFEELSQLMLEAGWPPSDIELTRVRWDTEYKDRRIISEFIKDGLLGKKRLASMPDRYTNTINTADGRIVMRPTVINCYDGDVGSVAAWWENWKAFVFTEKVSVKGKGDEVSTKAIFELFSPIKKSKYPAISEEEEAISIPLQTMACAIFDAINIHMMSTLAPHWEDLRGEMCDKLNRKKNSRTVDILQTTYADADVQFLQEVAGEFSTVAMKSALGKKYYDVLLPQALDSKRDQNSLILLKKGLFQDFHEVTEDVVSQCGGELPLEVVGVRPQPAESPCPVSPGDLFVLAATRVTDERPFLFASFHGDTNGLATAPVLAAVHKYATRVTPESTLLFGMDANTYENPKDDQQGVSAFAQFYTGLNLNSCYGPTPNPKNYTTFHARTYVQPQLNKAIRYAEKDEKGDRNPKDFIVFHKHEYEVLQTTKDNTGDQKYVEGMVFPTLAFPSDHGITWTKLLRTAG